MDDVSRLQMGFTSNQNKPAAQAAISNQTVKYPWGKTGPYRTFHKWIESVLRQINFVWKQTEEEASLTIVLCNHCTMS